MRCFVLLNLGLTAIVLVDCRVALRTLVFATVGEKNQKDDCGFWRQVPKSAHQELYSAILGC